MSSPSLAPLAKLGFRHAQTETRRPGNERPGNMGQNRPFGQVCGRVARPMVQETVKNKNTSGIKRNIVSDAKKQSDYVNMVSFAKNMAISVTS